MFPKMTISSWPVPVIKKRLYMKLFMRDENELSEYTHTLIYKIKKKKHFLHIISIYFPSSLKFCLCRSAFYPFSSFSFVFSLLSYTRLYSEFVFSLSLLSRVRYFDFVTNMCHYYILYIYVCINICLSCCICI